MTALLACRACRAAPLEPVLSLGELPLANALLTTAQLEQPEERFALDVVFCSRCGLLQLGYTVPPERLFRDYLYFSSYSESFLAHARELARHLTDRYALDQNKLVIELASNDGYLLQYYSKAGVRVLGVEPAANVARVASERGIPTVTEFFDEGLARKLLDQVGQADLIHANNVLAHVADLGGFVEGIRILLRPSGRAVLEFPYVRDMIENCEFDTIYHEHLSYFSLGAIERLFATHGLAITDVERLPVHGGSLRIFVAHAGAEPPSASVDALRLAEHQAGLGLLPYYLGFSERVQALKSELCRLLQSLRRKGKRLAAYGAAAKGNTLLGYCGVDCHSLEFVADRSTHKQGLFLPGSHVPVVAPEALLQRMPDHVLLLAWNLTAEVVRQEAAYLAAGGSFIVPVPEPRLLPETEIRHLLDGQ